MGDPIEVDFDDPVEISNVDPSESKSPPDLDVENKPYFRDDAERENAEMILDRAKVVPYTYLVRRTGNIEVGVVKDHVFVLTYFDPVIEQYRHYKLYRYPGRGWKTAKDKTHFYTTIDQVICALIPRGAGIAHNVK